MKIEQTIWTAATAWKKLAQEQEISPQVVFLFGDNRTLCQQNAVAYARSQYPGARIMGGTSAYEINHEGFAENSIVLTAVEFRKASLQCVRAPLTALSSQETARALADQLAHKDGLAHVFVLCEGLDVNGAAFVDALAGALPGISVTGGMVADKNTDEPDHVIFDGEMMRGQAIAVAFDRSVKAGYGSQGGWDSFGVDRRITKSHGKYVYEVDGKSALDLYKRYLGDEAKNLPHAGHYFPVLLKERMDALGVVRSVIQVDEKEGALIFSSGMPEGAYFRLMKTNVNNLIQGAAKAAEESLVGVDPGKKFLALLISCIGRQIVMKLRVEEEIEDALNILGDNRVMCGFYSLGEICPSEPGQKKPRYHNQTMTITTLSEADE